ncbi:MAG: hypothetical protein HOH43_22585 [Candidatus Latescibacteria bacterium]|jgi:hypothetical protein|nr:hypothetical protein [Candidatus Latescibacterota bacterium]
MFLTLACIILPGPVTALVLDGKVIDGKDPVEGARVRIHGDAIFVLTDAQGEFHLSTPVEAAGSIVVTAGKLGWVTGGVKITKNTSYTTIVITPVPDEDDPDYDFITPHKSLVDLRDEPDQLRKLRMRSHATYRENCNICHFEPTCFLCHRDIYDQWSTSFHSQSVTDPWVQQLYTGMDAEGSQNTGPGYRIDNPNDVGNCADCHAPSAAINAPGKTDLRVVYNRGVTVYPTSIGYKSTERTEIEKKAGSVNASGVHCDFCHKIKSVEVNDRPGVDGAIALTRANMKDVPGTIQGKLPTMFVYGPFDDVVDFSPVSIQAVTSPMVASYNPIYTSSDYCSACHQHRSDNGLPLINTYEEWKNSPYAEASIECQACHMQPDLEMARGTVVTGDAEKYWAPIESRDMETVKRHDFLGGHKNMMAGAAALRIETRQDNGQLRVRIGVENVNTGHHIPTGIAIRNMLLLVTPVLASGDTLEFTGQNVVPEYGGMGPVESGNYAGYPGKGFAMVFGDDEGNSAVMDWQATRILEDTRIEAKTTDISEYFFKLPATPSPISIHTHLIYRRAYKPLADIKKWELEDIPVSSDVTVITMK